MVVVGHAAVEPHAVVVEASGAGLAELAVLGPLWDDNLTIGAEGIRDRSLEGLVSLSGYVQDGHRVPIFTNLPHLVVTWVSASELPEHVQKKNRVDHRNRKRQNIRRPNK
jgi:hypothetical protein